MKNRLESWLSRLSLNRSVTIPVTRPLTTLFSKWSSLNLGALGIISHFRDIPRQDGTLLSAVGTEERPLQNGRCYVLDGSNDGVIVTAIELDADFQIDFSVNINDINWRRYMF
jgi:hypothetical protein